MIATSANRTPAFAAISASCRLVPGEAVFRSAHTAPPSGSTPASPDRQASTAALALLTLSTRSAPWAASASLPVLVMGWAAVTAGS